MIIGLLGNSGVGKNVAGKVLAKELNGIELAFAAPIKAFCKKGLGLTERQVNGNLKETPFKLGALVIEDIAQAAFDECGGIATRSRIHYESALRHWVSGLYKKTGLTPRYVMQTFGTEVVRHTIGKDHWANLGVQKSFALLEGGTNAVVFTDCRFRNEVLALKRAGGKVFRITRPSPSKTAKGNHASESEQSSIPNWWLDGVLNNDGTKVQFENQVRALTDELKSYEESWTPSLHPQLRDE